MAKDTKLYSEKDLRLQAHCAVVDAGFSPRRVDFSELQDAFAYLRDKLSHAAAVAFIASAKNTDIRAEDALEAAGLSPKNRDYRDLLAEFEFFRDKFGQEVELITTPKDLRLQAHCAVVDAGFSPRREDFRELVDAFAYLRDELGHPAAVAIIASAKNTEIQAEDALKAAGLSPKDRGYRDLLAEFEFFRGKFGQKQEDLEMEGLIDYLETCFGCKDAEDVEDVKDMMQKVGMVLPHFNETLIGTISNISCPNGKPSQTGVMPKGDSWWREKEAWNKFAEQYRAGKNKLLKALGFCKGANHDRSK